MAGNENPFSVKSVNKGRYRIETEAKAETEIETRTGIETEIETRTSVNKSDIEIPPPKDASRILTAPSWIWTVVLGVWLIIGIGIGLALFEYPLMLLTLLGYIILFVGWLVYSFQVVSEKERAKPIFLGQIGKLVGSGPMFVLQPLERLARYPTEVQQITFAHAGILTKKENEITPVLLPVVPVLNFQWPWRNDELTLAIRNAPPPTEKGLEELKNQIEEPFLDIVRTVGGRHTYEWIAQSRVQFAEEVTEELKKSRDLTGLIELFQLKNTTISMKHIEIPDVVKTGLEAEAAALPTSRATRIQEKEKRFGIAEGEEEIRRRIMEVIAEYPEAMSLEALITLRESMATGKAGWIIMPQEVSGALSKSLGGVPIEKAISGMSDKQFKKLTEMIEKLE